MVAQLERRSRQLVDAVASLDGTAQTWAQQAQEILAGAQEQLASSEEMLASANALREMAEALRLLIERFQTDEEEKISG